MIPFDLRKQYTAEDYGLFKVLKGKVENIVSGNDYPLKSYHINDKSWLRMRKKEETGLPKPPGTPHSTPPTETVDSNIGDEPVACIIKNFRDPEPWNDIEMDSYPIKPISKTITIDDLELVDPVIRKVRFPT